MVLERAVLVAKRTDRLRNTTGSRRRGSKDESRVLLEPAAHSWPAMDCLYSLPATVASPAQRLLYIATQ